MHAVHHAHGHEHELLSSFGVNAPRLPVKFEWVRSVTHNFYQLEVSLKSSPLKLFPTFKKKLHVVSTSYAMNKEKCIFCLTIHKI